jgi:hypothetical protein
MSNATCRTCTSWRSCPHMCPHHSVFIHQQPRHRNIHFAACTCMAVDSDPQLQVNHLPWTEYVPCGTRHASMTSCQLAPQHGLCSVCAAATGTREGATPPHPQRTACVQCHTHLGHQAQHRLQPQSVRQCSGISCSHSCCCTCCWSLRQLLNPHTTCMCVQQLLAALACTWYCPDAHNSCSCFILAVATPPGHPRGRPA